MANAPEKKKDKLTVKERKLIKGMAKGLSVAEAARKAGYSESSVDSTVHTQLQGNTRLRTAFQKLLDKEGISDALLSKTIREGLEAHKVISANIIKNKKSDIADKQDGMKEADESTKDFVEVPDFMARHKFVDTVLKLKEHYPAEKQKVEHSGAVRLITNVTGDE